MSEQFLNSTSAHIRLFNAGKYKQNQKTELSTFNDSRFCWLDIFSRISKFHTSQSLLNIQQTSLSQTAVTA